jgi:hypothetical protein
MPNYSKSLVVPGSSPTFFQLSLSLPEDGVLHVTLQKSERGKLWQSALAGHTSLDPLSSEQEQKRLMLERFQQEVRLLAKIPTSTGRS